MKTWVAYLGAHLLLAGSVYTDSVTVTKNVGDVLGTAVRTVLKYDDDIKCYLDTPHGTIEIWPNNSPPERYKIKEDNTLSSCSVDVTELNEDDTGHWEIYFTINGDVVASEIYELTVNELLVPVNLEKIEHRTKLNDSIDISLSKISYDEKCSIITPDGETVLADTINIPGVTVHSSSNFVSCRITIGPMNTTLIGNWSLCGEYEETGKTHLRCQPVSISWHNTNDPSRQWDVNMQSRFNHAVSLDGNLSPIVTGFGNVISCHIVTPNGEDLVITTDTDYPGLTRIVTMNTAACNINIGPIENKYLGDWTIYGKFDSILGMNEVALPMHLFIYDEENPYTQPYNVTNENPTVEVINLGSTIDIEIRGTGNRDDCEVISSTGEKYSLSGVKGLEPVSFNDVGTSATCQVSIGPITDEMLGKWQFSGKFNNRNIYTEMKRTIEIIKEDPANPIIDENRTVENMALEYFNTTLGSTLEITIPVYSFVTTESCHLRTPDGLQYTIMEGFNMDGIQVIEDRNVACGIIVDVKNSNMIGDWILIARVLRFSDPVETRLPFTIYVEELFVPVNLEKIEHRTKLNDSIDISLNKISHNEKCSIITPDGETVLADTINIPGVTVHSSSNFVSCRITIGPMNTTLIGNWSLCGEYEESGKTHLRCQPVSISWHNTNDPSRQWDVNMQSRFNHAVSLDGNLSPIVTGFGNVISCHIVTPNGEDLVITTDTDYPGLTRIVTMNTAACNINIGPIENKYLGDWTIYGKFNSILGMNEVALPMYLFIYDEENPYTQPYNVTNENPTVEVINLGSTIDIEIRGTGNRDDCEVISSTGQKYSLSGVKGLEPVSFNDVGTSATCQVSIGPITYEMLGKWQFSGKFNNRNIYTEMKRTIEIIKEDPANPIIDENRTVENMALEYFNTTLGSTHEITIPVYSFVTTESCHLRTPDGLQYTIMEGFNVDGIRVIEDRNVACGIIVDVKNSNMIGDWILIARVLRFSDPMETRLPFTVYVEETVKTSPSHITITEGNDLYLRLTNATDLNGSCKLYSPEKVAEHYEMDVNHNDRCGFIVKNITKSESGLWEIRYGTGITYRAFTEVNVVALSNTTLEDLQLDKDKPVDVTFGPDNAIYCKIEDPSGRVVFDNFRRCNIVLEKAMREHNGNWSITIGLPGRVLTDEYTLNVIVTEPAPKAVVTTSVEKQQPEVILTCSVHTEHEVQACKFREPSGRVLLAAHGVGESRYSFHGSGISMESGVRTHECGLRITNTQVQDLGIWRCAVETDKETYYGFISVLCPWAMQDPNVAASVVSEPTLAVNHQKIAAKVGDTVTMSCSVQSAIEYCYFRAANGTVFSVTPETSAENMEYVGAGLDAGECGIAFTNLLPSDSGNWSCHVGLPGNNQLEQRASFKVAIRDSFMAHQFRINGGLIVEGLVYNRRALDYCRFVRIDGLGFKSSNLPQNYYNYDILSDGQCSLFIESPTVLDLHPWTVVARIKGQDVEVSGVTGYDELSPPPPVPLPVQRSNTHWFLLWSMTFFVVFILMSLASILIPKKNRNRAYAGAAFIRNSFRQTFQKKPLPLNNIEHVETSPNP